MLKIFKRFMFSFLFFYIVGFFFLSGSHAQAKNSVTITYTRNSILPESELIGIAKKNNPRDYFVSDKVMREKMCRLEWEQCKKCFKNKKQYMKYKKKYDVVYKYKLDIKKYEKPYDYGVSNCSLNSLSFNKPNNDLVFLTSVNDNSAAEPSSTPDSSSNQDNFQRLTDAVVNLESLTSDLRIILIVLGCMLAMFYGSMLALFFKRPNVI